jgi:predicted phage terminase large subunit-like protein
VTVNVRPGSPEIDDAPLVPAVISPAYWAAVTNQGEWRAQHFHAVINEALVEVMAARDRGEAAHLIIMAPSQHGKTTLVAHAFPGVWLGYFPEDRIILTSFESKTAEERGETVRDEIDEFGPSIFNIRVDPFSNAAGDWRLEGHRGGMKSRGVGGAITGSPCDLFLIDDPVKDDKEVRSPAFREDQWRWYMKVARKRMRSHTCSVMIYTAWHPHDLGQRIIRASVKGDLPKFKILRFPVLSETQEERDRWAEDLGLPLGEPDPAGRVPGQALWDETIDLQEIERWKRVDPEGFYAIGQGRPRVEGGNIWSRDFVLPNLVKPSDVPRDARFVRAWDKASGTSKRSNFTASCLMARSESGKFRYYVINVTKDKLSPYSRDLKIKGMAWSDKDRWGSVCNLGDVDPGQAGVSDAQTFRQLLESYWVETNPVAGTGDKEYRFRPFVSASEGGNVAIVGTEDGDVPHWFAEWAQELEDFPRGVSDDQVDATASAYAKLSGNNSGARFGRNLLDNYEGEVAVAPRQEIEVYA